MPFKPLAERFRTKDGVNYGQHCIAEGKTTKEAREFYRKSKDYKGEDFLLIKSPEFYESYDVYIPTNLK